jgi:predicted glutamine amidotransferase
MDPCAAPRRAAAPYPGNSVFWSNCSNCHYGRRGVSSPALRGFRKRGDDTDVHADGWGIAFFEGNGVRLFLDPQPSEHSPIADLVRHYPIRSLNVIAHIRKATQGIVSL